ncbi:MAG: EAL domain-containing protein [Candidatus Pelethousia sp.]|nr:EAL domain-containing protein [Candidatus Pelethousia sp.]
MEETKRRRGCVGISKRWVLCLVLCFTLLPLFPAKALADQNKVVKVGAFFYAGDLDAGVDDSYIGYVFDYLREISQYTGWRYEFVNASWNQCFTMLREGEIDLMAPVGKMAEREAMYAFSQLPMASGSCALVTRLDNETIPYEDFVAFDSLRVGILADSRMEESFLLYSQANGFSSQLIYYDAYTKIKEDLDAGKIDAATISSIFPFSDFRTIAKFGNQDFYFLTAKGNEDVLNGLNQAMEQIQIANPYYNSELNQKYAQMQNESTVSFTREEINYIKEQGTIRCAYNPDARPISYYDTENRQFRGVAADLCALLEEKSGLRFVFVHMPTYRDSLRLFTAQEVDLLIGMEHVPGWSQKNGAFLTKSYLESQIVMVTNGKEQERPVVALYDEGTKSGRMESAIRAAERVDYYPSAAECLDAVESGKADLTFINSTIMDYHKNDPQYANLQTTVLSGGLRTARIAVAGDQDPILVSILNKTLASISTAQLDEILAKNMKVGILTSLKNMLRVQPLDLIVVLAGALLIITLVLIIMFQSRSKSANEMRKMLYTDALTGYSNYKALNEAAPKLLGDHPERYALVYIDMHQFKYINDTLGYDAGDEVLQMVSQTLADYISEEERFARVYADKFVLLLKVGEDERFLTRLEELSGRLSRLRTGKYTNINFVFRGGVYRLGKDSCDIDMACDRANYAKDTAQSSFTTTFGFYDELVHSQIMGEKWLESNMQPALERGDFIPYYQPKVNVVTGAMVGAEALVRWRHPEEGILFPATFIPFFEKNGFVTHIDFAIFTEVCRNMRDWADAGKTLFPISVNFSRCHVLNPYFSQRLKAIADRFKIPTNLLEVEITETVSMDDLDMAVDFVQSLKKQGFLISIDDYGTGYSSVAFLQKLPLDVLKLDKSFVENAMRCKKARDIMRHLITAVLANQIRVVCEGIETEEQKDFIISQNCCFAQGYLYSKPVPVEEFEAYLSRTKISTNEYMEYQPTYNFEEFIRSNAGDFLERVMPGWVFGSYVSEGYPIFYMCRQMIASLGYSESEFLYETGGLFENCLHPQDRTRILTEMDLQNKKGGEYALQYRMRKKDGGYLWIRDNGKKILTDGGREALLCVCTDITDMVLLQQDKDAIIGAIPGGVCELLPMPEGPTILTATDGFYTVIGHSREEMEETQNKLFSIVCVADLPEAKKIFRNVIDRDAPTCECTLRVLHGDNTVHWISIHGTIRTTDYGKVITATSYNIDGEMQARQDAEIVKAKLELALTLTDHAVFEYDIRTKTIYEQSGLQEIFSPEMSLHNVPDSLIKQGFIHPQDASALQEQYRRIAQGEPHASCDVRMRSIKATACSPYIWMRAILSTIYDEAGRAVKAVGIVENIDREKRIEHEFAQEGQYREALTASSILAYDVNLTLNTIARISGTYTERLLQICHETPEPQSYSKIIESVAKTIIAEGDRARFLRDMSLIQLRRLERDGIKEQEYEYRRLMPDGSESWVATSLHLMPDRWNGDLICLIYYRDIQARKSMEESLQYRATRDALTGLLNRASGERRIQEFLSSQECKRGIHAFLMIDMDHFKKVNDTYGHQYGDLLLVNVAKAVSRNLRSSDIVTRMGGDEFIVLVKDLREEKRAKDVAQKLALAITVCGRDMNIPFKSVVSIGVALVPRDGMDFDTLYRRADEAMYAAKKNGNIRISMVGEAQEK